MMTVSWYRKWRPKTFSDVIGQEHIVSTLRRSLEQGRVSHAYLFTGPRGVGKTTTARLLAKSVNCLSDNEKKGFDPCGKCALCVSFENDSMIDVIEIDAASNRGIDDVRALRETIAFSPTTGKYKVYIIDEVHMLTKEAFNALLKTLEEPPSHVILILATTDVGKVPETILSRCQRFDFRPISGNDLKKHLLKISSSEQINLTEDGAVLISEFADGSGRDAISLLQQLSVIEGNIDAQKVKEMLGILTQNEVDVIFDYILSGNITDGLKMLEESIEKGIDPELIVKMVLRAISKSVKGVYESNWSSKTTIQQKIATADSWAWALTQVKSHTEPFLVLATAFLDSVPKTSTTQKKDIENQESSATPVVVQAENKPQSKTEEIHTLVKASWNPSDGEKQLWQKLISGAKPFNHSLSALLKDAELLSIENGDPGIVNIGVNLPFYKERIMEIKNRRILEDLLKQITGVSFMLKCSLITKGKTPSISSSEDDLAKAAAEVFMEQ